MICGFLGGAPLAVASRHNVVSESERVPSRRVARSRKAVLRASEEEVEDTSPFNSAFKDDSCDLFGKNCGPDGEVPEAATRVIPTKKTEPQTATMAGVTVQDYDDDKSVFPDEAEDTTGH